LRLLIILAATCQDLCQFQSELFFVSGRLFTDPEETIQGHFQVRLADLEMSALQVVISSKLATFRAKFVEIGLTERNKSIRKFM